MAGVAGARYDVLIEAYAGHGLRTAGKGPVAYGRESVPEPPPAQVVVGETTFGIWNEEVYQLWLDVETLFQTRNQLDPDSLRVAEIDAGLRDFTLIADLELPPAEFLATVERRGRGSSRCSNASTAPPRRPSSPSATRTSTWPGSGRCKRPSARWRAPSARSWR